MDRDESNELYGAGDQGIMFGYACDETDNFMPAPIDYSHKILKTLANYRHNNDSFLVLILKVKLVCFTKITDQKNQFYCCI